MKIFPTIVKRIVQVVSGSVNWLAAQSPAIALTPRADGSPAAAVVTPGVAVSIGASSLRIGQSPAFALTHTAAGTAAAANVNGAYALTPRADGSAATEAQAAGVAVALQSTSLRIAQSPALDIDTSASGSSSASQSPALAITAPKQVNVSGTSQTPAFDVVQFKVDLTHRSGATTATNTGADAWTNPTNAQGLNNAGNATSVGEALAARTRVLELAYADMVSKTSLTITAVNLHFYVTQTGTALNNGYLELRRDVGAGFVTLEIIQGDVTSVPRTFDITAAIGGDWTKVDALKANVEHRTDLGELLINATVDAVEVEVIATVTQTL